MNLLYKGMFYLKSRDLIKDILTFLLPETKINEVEMNKVDKKLSEIVNVYDKISW